MADNNNNITMWESMDSGNDTVDDVITGIPVTSGYFDEAIISENSQKWFIFVNHVVISMGFCLFGIANNCVNIKVFVRQGLRRSVNLSLWAISVSDLLGLIFQTWHNFCLNPFLPLADLPVEFMEVQLLTGGCPNVLMVRITCWITMYLTAERCLSVLAPLKVRRIVTFERTACILTFIVILNFSFLLPLYTVAFFSWNYYPEVNRTKLGISFRGRAEASDIINTGHIALTLISFVLVILFTGILVISLRRRSRWRRGATSDLSQQEALTSRENKTVGLIVVVAGALIACQTPGVACSVVTCVFPEFDIYREYAHVFNAVWSFCFLFHSVNSSINIILYYKMSSKYRATLQVIFPILKHKK